MTKAVREDVQTPAQEALRLMEQQLDAIQKGMNVLRAQIRAVLTSQDHGPGDLPDSDATETEQEKRELLPKDQQKLLMILKTRFATESKSRPKDINFSNVQKALEAKPELFWSLYQMETTGGEPDIVSVEGNEYIFEDRSAESPSGRRRQNAYEAEKHSEDFGAPIMSEAEYRAMQKTGNYDRGTWSWVKSPKKMLDSGRALRGNRCAGGVDVLQGDAGFRINSGGWRGVLRVPKA